MVSVGIWAVGRLSRDDRAGMERLYRAYYEGADEGDFARDFTEKDWAIVLRDSEGVRGFGGVLYYHECRMPEERMAEMLVDFDESRLRLKFAPHDALGWESRRYDSLRLDVALTPDVMRELSKRAGEVASAARRDVSSASLDAALSHTTCYVRIGRGDAAVERFSELSPHGWTEMAHELLRFAASLGELRPESGERAACCDWARDM